MSKNVDLKYEKNSFVYFLPTTADRIKLMSISEKNAEMILNAVLIDVDRQSDIKLGEYYNNTLHYRIEAMPVQNYVLLDCAEWLKKMSFDNFSVIKIFVRYSKKEIIVVSDKMSDEVLEEFYRKTFEFAYMNDREIVFIITTENKINYSEMPKYDTVIEVENNE